MDPYDQNINTLDVITHKCTILDETQIRGRLSWRPVAAEGVLTYIQTTSDLATRRTIQSSRRGRSVVATLPNWT